MPSLEFSLHGRVTLRVDADAPTAPQLAEMFAPFASPAPSTGPAHLQVSGRRKTIEDASVGEHDFRYDATSVEIARTGVQVERTADGFAVHGTRELLTTLLPLVDRTMVMHGAAMVHAATVDYRGLGLLMPAWGGVGKTSTVAKLLRLEGVGFMGDDWAFLSDVGTVLPYLKPMFIKPHHRPIYPHLFAEKGKPLIPSALSRPVARLTTIVHPFITRYPRVAGISRRWSPEHLMVAPADAFPAARMAAPVPVGVVVFVERYEGADVLVEERKREWMVSRIIGNFNVEMTVESREVLAALAATSLLPMEVHFGEKAEVLREGIGDVPCFLMKVPVSFSADRASDEIVERLQRAVEAAQS